MKSIILYVSACQLRFFMQRLSIQLLAACITTGIKLIALLSTEPFQISIQGDQKEIHASHYLTKMQNMERFLHIFGPMFQLGAQKWRYVWV